MYKFRKYGWNIFAAAMVMAALLWGIFFQQEDWLNRIQIQDSIHSLNLKLFHDETDGLVSLFLPAHATVESLRMEIPSGIDVMIADDTKQYRNTLSGIPTGKRLQLTIQSALHAESYPFEIRQCTNLPTIYIEAENGILNYLHEDVSNKKDVLVNVLDTDGSKLLQAPAVLSGRGNGSWIASEKKPYNLKFTEAVSFGAFDSVRKLCLLSESLDGSKLRNALAFYWAEAVEMPYASPYQYVNLYVNGEFRGLYGLSTKQEYEKYLQSDAIDTVFEWTVTEKKNSFPTGLGIWNARVMHGSTAPLAEDITQISQAIAESDWAFCERQINFPSVAKKYVLDEFLGNYDLSFSSQYMYLDEDRIFHSMLPWDYDWSLGNCVDFFNNKTEYQLFAYRYPGFWLTSLIQSEAFQRAILLEIEEHYTDQALQQLTHHMQKLISEISDSRECDALRWKSTTSTNHWEPMGGHSHLEEMGTWLEAYFPERRTFLYQYFSNPDDYCRIEFFGIPYANMFIPKGEQLSPYLENAAILNFTISDGSIRRYVDGDLTPQQVGTVTQDITFMPSDWFNTEE